MNAPSAPLWASSETAAVKCQQLLTLANRLKHTIGVARALVGVGRALDLTGIDDGIGILCAQILDLPRDTARTLLPHLHEVLAQADGLSRALRAGAARETG